MIWKVISSLFRELCIYMVWTSYILYGTDNCVLNMEHLNQMINHCYTESFITLLLLCPMRKQQNTCLKWY